MVKALTLYVCIAAACIVDILTLQPKKVEFKWVTPSTVALIENFEGKRHKAYKDSQGNWTVGIGHLIRVKEHDLLRRELSEDEVRGILHQDLEKCTTALKMALNVPITRTQSDAMHSLCHNIGPDKMVHSDVVKYVNLGEPEKAGNAFLNWSKPTVLRKRRQAERAVFLAEI